MNELALAAYLTIKKPEFPTPQEIAITCEQSAPCATVKAQEEERLRVEADLRQTALRLQPTGTYGNGYAYGHCTALAASMVPVPSGWGNANTWDDFATAQGWRVTNQPRRGAIAQTDTGYYGHVAVVLDVNGDSVYIEEQNYIGWNRVSFRWSPISEFRYIY